ncbi:MAG: putative fructoselysine transporter [Methanomassiliicoccales archaeon PtaU1.Bin124]|nr:MAG: putative fructoselysine transporter [Methanomassiliicoccales archaeon PtaU1.Bin124]
MEGEVDKSGKSEVQVTLRRDLGLLEVLMIGIGPNIGSTIFILIGTGTSIAGPAIILAMVLNFFVTLTTAFSYAELASAFPETGGGYLWIKEGLFPPFGFLGGWMSWVGHCIACSVYALGFGTGIVWAFNAYNIDFFGLGETEIRILSSVLIALVFIYLNYRGVKGAGRSEIIVSVILIGVITTFILFALGSMMANPNTSKNYADFIPNGTLSVLTSMAFTFMVFEGYEVVAQTGEEAKNPEKTVPRAMFMCIGISTFLFVAVAITAIGVSGWHDIAAWKDFAIINAADAVMGNLGAGMIAFGILIGSVAAVNSIVFSVSRVSFAMGRDGNLPSRFGKLHPKNHTPTTALFVSGAIIIAMCIFLPMDSVAAVADILILLLFMLVNMAAISLRVKQPDAKRYFLTPLFPLFPIVGIILKLILAATLFDYEPSAWYLALMVILLGLMIHYFAKGRKEIEAAVVEQRIPMSAEELKKFRVLLPVDENTNETKIDMGCLLAAEKNGELMLINVVEIPSAVPISDVNPKLVDERKRMVERFKKHAEANGIKTRAIVTVSHDVVTALIDTAKEEDVNTILVGWKGYTNTQKRTLGKKMDLLLRLTPCDVLLLKSDEKFRPERILILSGGLWHVSRATEVAAMIAKKYNSRVTILNVIAEEKYIDVARKYSDRLTEILERSGVPVVVKEIRPEVVVGGVISESIEYDLLVMGSSAVKRVHRSDFGIVQDRIVKSAKCPVLIYKRVATFEDKEEQEAEVVDVSE